MLAERLVADMRSLHGWKHCAAEWLGWIKEALSDDCALLVELVDDVQVRKSDIRVDVDVGDVTTAPAITESSRSWCEHDNFALDSVCYTIILRALLVVVLELYDRCFDSVCLSMFGFAHRVLILSLRTAYHAALAHLEERAPSKLDSRGISAMVA